jgi:hypothetical protein
LSATTLDLADGESLDLLWYGFVDVGTSLQGLISTVNGAAGAGIEVRIHNTSIIRAEAQDDGSGAVADVSTATYTVGVPFVARARLTGAESPSNDAIFAVINGAADAGGSSDLGAISSGEGIALGSRRTNVLANGMDGRIALAAAKIGGWSGAELTAISDYLVGFFAHGGGA